MAKYNHYTWSIVQEQQLKSLKHAETRLKDHASFIDIFGVATGADSAPPTGPKARTEQLICILTLFVHVQSLQVINAENDWYDNTRYALFKTHPHNKSGLTLWIISSSWLVILLTWFALWRKSNVQNGSHLEINIISGLLPEGNIPRYSCDAFLNLWRLPGWTSLLEHVCHLWKTPTIGVWH